MFSLGLFSSSRSNTGNFDASNGPPSATARRSGSNGPIGLFGSPSNVQYRGGRSSVVQSPNVSPGNVLWPGAHLTDEPISDGDTNGRSGRGRAPLVSYATPAIHNEAQALAIRFAESALAAPENARSESPLQLPPVAKVEEFGVDEVRQDPSYEEVASKPAQIFSRRYFSRKSSFTTSYDQSFRYPLRTGTDPPSTPYSTVHDVRPRPHRMSTMRENWVGLPRAFKAPLQTTLFSGSRNMFAPPTPPATSITSILHILAVGIPYGNLQDPLHDIDILRTLLGGRESKNTRFKGISGNGVTLQMIEEAIDELYRESLKSSGSNLLILLTGEGDEQNRMYVTNDVFITDEDLRRWMWKLQIDCHPNNRTVTIILDYCRMNPKLPFGKPHFGVEFIWSCSPGQFAAALRFPSTQDIPRSCFLLSLMMSSYHLAYTKSDIVASVNFQLHRLLRFLALTHKKVHEAGRCVPCNNQLECPIPCCPQDPDWQQVGSMKSIYDLVDRLSQMEITHKVNETFMRHRYFREANGLTVSEPTYSYHSGTTQHSRGSSKPVYAAPNSQIGLRKLPEDGRTLIDLERFLRK
ncbi:unnamed protein product [Rhizoctonia solani]|uniref:Uncharacterized protein n=1 Tax=Rhizoctonia solani TaxID=456999 RepID=A0A8H3E2A6_9AGAM|nr:unnamed protein product [Rhizoctonia solani]